MNELEDGLECEKKVRADLDKAKRRLKTELKQSLSTVDNLERVKRNLKEATKHKDVKYGALIIKYKDKNPTLSQVKRKVKDTTNRIEDIEEELKSRDLTSLRSWTSSPSTRMLVVPPPPRLTSSGGARASSRNSTTT